jgi:DEAD/DEAH box helicase domain-containing protein
MLQVFFDVETKNTLDEVGGYFPERLDISFVGACIRNGQSGEGEMRGFFEKDLPDLCNLLESADVVIGFNSDGFDLPTLTRHYQGNIKEIPSLDLMARIKNSCGHRIGLDAVTKATFNLGKTGNGLDAIRYYKEGKLKELADYCLQDVRITRDLYDYGFKNSYVKFMNKWNRLIECPVDFSFTPKVKVGKQDSLF